MSVTLPSLTIQDMRGDDAHQLIPYHVEDIRGVDDMTFVQDRFIQPAQGDTATFDLIPAPAQYFDPQTYREATAGLDKTSCPATTASCSSTIPRYQKRPRPSFLLSPARLIAPRSDQKCSRMSSRSSAHTCMTMRNTR